MSSYQGLQTHEFLTRLKKCEGELPPLLLDLARLMQTTIEGIASPQLENVLQLQAEMRRQIGDPQALREICGMEGSLCPRCPFGAYLPSGFPFASEERAVCLPWIVVVHPQPPKPE